MKSFSQIWENVKQHCLENMSDVAFETWIEPLSPVSFDGDKVVIDAGIDFTKKIVESKFSDILLRAFESVMGFDVTLEFVASKEDEDLKETSSASGPAIQAYDVESTFDTFVVGSSNKFAFAASQSVAQKPGQTYNPLFIYGNSGLGKTHLLNAICFDIQKNYPEMEIISTTGEDFTNELISYIANDKRVSPFKEKYRNADILLMDDIQFISGKDRTQEEFFHTFNALNQAGKQIVLTSDRPPKEILTLEERLRTRFEWGLIADIQPPDFETRIAIIQRKADALDIALSSEVVEFIANKIKNNIRQLEGAVKKLKAYQEMEGQRPSVAMAKAAIKDIMTDIQPIPVTVERIIQEVGRTFDVTPDELVSSRREAKISGARQVAAYVISEVIGMSLKSIGEELGNRDHTTILYSLQKVEERMDANAELKSTVSDIITNIKES